MQYSSMAALADHVRSRSVEVGECWEWQGAVHSRSVSPFMKWRGQVLNVRRALAIDEGRSVSGRCVTMCCGNRLCVNPAHLQLLFRSALSSRTAKTLNYQSPARVARISASLRASGRLKLTPEAAADIRRQHADGVPGPEIAAQYGVNKATVASIVRGATWRDYSSPFSQLFTLARSPCSSSSPR